MKGKSNFEGKRHTHATKLQIGFSQEGHRNAAGHKWTVDKETGKEHRVTGDKPRGSRWGRTNRFSQWIHAKEENEVWDKPNPVKNHDKLSPAMKARAKARAKAAGRRYPNMVDNMWAARNEDTPADRLMGTTSLAMKYLKDTPGQGRKKMTKKLDEANPIDVPAYKRKPLTLDTLRKALTKDKMGNDKISHPDVLAKNRGVKTEETVNELKKSTLASYTRDAALDSTRLGNTLGRAQQDGGISGKEIAKQVGKKIGNRLDGIRRATSKLQK